MKSLLELEIDAPTASVAELFDDPDRFPRWMDDVAKVERLDGASGARPGTRFRLVPKEGDLVFVGTVMGREPPHRSHLVLESPTVSVSVTGKFTELSGSRTKLVSEETFIFKGLLGRLFGVLSYFGIRRAHRRHMEAFKRFAELTPSPGHAGASRSA
jgi:uncharacterized protein YndB with AHSA1/START domain